MQNRSSVSLLVAAGGTGGDLFPTLAILERLRRLLAARVELEPIFIGNPDRIEGRIIPQRGYRFVPIPMRGYYGLWSARTYAMMWRLPVSLLRTWYAVIRHKPRCAVLAGAYLGIPVAIVARLYRIPIVLVEINAVPGKANRLLAKWAERILVSSDDCRSAFPSAVQGRIVVTGTPIRDALRSLPDPTTARTKFDLSPNRPTLLVMGGSLGAHSINEAIAMHLDNILAAGWQVLWQTGGHDQAPKRNGVVTMPFIDDMASAYAAADLVLCRAGGSTIAELIALQKPAILVPYPHAANREQEKNAAFLARRGGAIMIEDRQLSPNLWHYLEPLLFHSNQRESMRQALASLQTPDPTGSAAKIVAQLLV